MLALYKLWPRYWRTEIRNRTRQVNVSDTNPTQFCKPCNWPVNGPDSARKARGYRHPNDLERVSCLLSFCYHARPIGVDAPSKLSKYLTTERKCGNLRLAIANVPDAAVTKFTVIEGAAKSSASC